MPPIQDFILSRGKKSDCYATSNYLVDICWNAGSDCVRPGNISKSVSADVSFKFGGV